jgi:NitT/TauT family transport system ATP-binding protein
MLRLDVDDLLPTVDAAQLLGFADVLNGDVLITPVGHEFATADVQRSKDLFREQFLKNVPFVSSVVETLRQKKTGKVGKDFFIDILDEHFSNVEAENQFETLLTWGRYAQLFDYDSNGENLVRVDEEE